MQRGPLRTVVIPVKLAKKVGLPNVRRAAHREAFRTAMGLAEMTPAALRRELKAAQSELEVARDLRRRLKWTRQIKGFNFGEHGRFVYFVRRRARLCPVEIKLIKREIAARAQSKKSRSSA